MQRVVVRGSGGPEVLHIIDQPTPNPGRSQVRIRVETAGVAFGDVMRRRGVLAPPWAFTPGYDVVGHIDAVGAGIDTQQLGDRVAVLLPNTGFGGYSTHVCVEPRHCVPVPNDVDSIQAVALGLNYITAWQILNRMLNLRVGQRALIHGAAGGVGTAALQIGQHLGLDLFGTASAPKHSVLTQYGATPIDYRTQDFVEHVQQAGGVDGVLDPIGGDHLYRSYACLRKGGTLVSLGLSGDLSRGLWGAMVGAAPWLRLRFRRDSQQARLYLINQGDSRTHLQRDWERLLDLHLDGVLQPHIGQVVPFVEIAKAHDLLDRAAVVGKVVLTFP